MLNNLTLVGRLTADPTMKRAKDLAIAEFSLAVNPKKDGDAYFFDCAAFGKTAELVGKYAKKGTQLGIVGSLKQDVYTNKEGKTRSKVSIVVNQIMLFGKPEAKPEAVDTTDLPF